MQRFRLSALASAAAIVLPSANAAALEPVRAGDWVRFRVIKASEWTEPAVEEIVLTAGDPVVVDDVSAVRWQLLIAPAEGRPVTLDVVSERMPMTAPDGDIGLVFAYTLRAGEESALRYVDARSGRAKLPRFGFRDGLVPTPRTDRNVVGPFYGTGAYLGQLLSACDQGTGCPMEDLGEPTRLVLDDDVLVGTARWIKDDGTGQDPETLEYTYVDLDADDYARMIDAGFNIFRVNDQHLAFVLDQPVFFCKSPFGSMPYPEILYRSNYWGAAMFTDEPAIRLDGGVCRSIHDGAALLRLRNHAYHRMPGSAQLDPRHTQADGVIQLIHRAGFNVGDWLPIQDEVPVWETIIESAFYQLQGGAAGIVHEGRYGLEGFNAFLAKLLGPGAEVDETAMFDLVYSFMRGAARCFDGDWGMAVYGQADYSLAPMAVRRAYDMGARYLWFWTSDHDHHLPWLRQLEMARIIRDHQREHPRADRRFSIHGARVAVAIPDGYVCDQVWMWGNPWFRHDHTNQHGVPYGDVIAEAYWKMIDLQRRGIPFDCVVDDPAVLDRAGYDHVIRIDEFARVDEPAPALPPVPPAVTVTGGDELDSWKPRSDAPRVTAPRINPDAIRIDGDFDDWEDADWISLDHELMYEVVHARREGDADLSARAAFAWDGPNLYIAVDVRDDRHNATEAGELIWQNDCVQVAFDPLFNPHIEGFYAPDDCEIGFSLADGRPYAHRWNRSIAGPPGEIRGALVAIRRDGDRTRYEARVPFAVLTPLTPAFPGVCGMSVAVNDSDTNLRKGAIAWTTGLVDAKNPSQFGVLEFARGDAASTDVASTDAPPLFFLQPEATVVNPGASIRFRLDTGSAIDRPAEITVRLRHDELRALPASVEFTVPAGTRRFDVELPSDQVPPGRYHAEITLAAEGAPAIETTQRVYVLPHPR